MRGKKTRILPDVTGWEPEEKLDELLTSVSWNALTANDNEWSPYEAANDNEEDDPDSPIGGGASIPVRQTLVTGSQLLDQLVSITTGKALPGEDRIVSKMSPFKAWLASVVGLIVSLLLNIAVVATLLMGSTNLALLCLGSFLYFWLTLVTVGRLRSQQVQYAHHGVHGAVTESKSTNKFITSASLALAIGQNPEEYASDHVKFHHRRNTFTTLEDPDAAFLNELGFKPGMTKKALWRKLGITLISPRYHAKFLYARLRSALWTSKPRHKLMVIGWLSLLGIVGLQIGWVVALLTIIIPLTVLYQNSALLQFLTEHKWQFTKNGPVSHRDYADRCVGRFCGEALPTAKAGKPIESLFRMLAWGFRMTFLHVPTRLAVLVGDMPAHDIHHIAGPLNMDARLWRDAIFEREKAIQAGDEFGLSERERWGLFAMVDWVFEGFATGELG